jgi:hypothetical protein
MAIKYQACVLAVAMGICGIPSTLMAGADPAVIQPPAVPAHHFLDARNIGVISLNSIIMAADIATTRRALQAPGAYEANPLMRNQEAAIALKAASVGAGVGVAYMLHKSGHHKAERYIPMFLGVPSAIAAAHNASIR